MTAPDEKSTYRILVDRSALFEFEVRAKSAAEACKTMQRKLLSGEITETNAVKQLGPDWADPTKEGDVWLVQNMTPDPVEAYDYIMAWNGKEIIDSGMQPVLRDARHGTAETRTGKKFK